MISKYQVLKQLDEGKGGGAVAPDSRSVAPVRLQHQHQSQMRGQYGYSAAQIKQMQQQQPQM
jgi:hypothetical protein